MEKDYKPYMKAVKNGFIVCYYTEKEGKDANGMEYMHEMKYDKHEVVFPFYEYHDATMALMKYAAMNDDSLNYDKMAADMMNKPNGLNPHSMGSNKSSHNSHY